MVTSHVDSSFKTILGLRFHTGGPEGLWEHTQRGGLIVVPSAPVLAALPHDSAHRAALEGSDFAITDSGLLVLLWLFLRGEKLPRISGLRFMRDLLTRPEFREPGATFWIKPSAKEADANLRWLQKEGVSVSPDDCYLAPMYGDGPLEDPALLAAIEARKPKFIIIALGGGVQERLGHYLRRNLTAFADNRTADSANQPYPAPDRVAPAIICTGAAIAFLTGQQTNIPTWADRLFLGWLMRSLDSPKRYVPRYVRALKLAPLVLRHGRNPVPAYSGAGRMGG